MGIPIQRRPFHILDMEKWIKNMGEIIRWHLFHYNWNYYRKHIYISLIIRVKTEIIIAVLFLVTISGEVKKLSDILKDPDLYHLLSDKDDPMIMTNNLVAKLPYP